MGVADVRERVGESDSDMLRSYLAERDCACPGCGYNVRGLPSGRCPECNQVLVLLVGLAEPRMGLFLAAVIGAAAGLGLNGLLLLYAVVAIARFGMGGFFNYFIVHNAAGAVAQGLMLCLLLARGPRIRRWGRGLRVALAVAMWALSLVNVAIFSLFVR